MNRLDMFYELMETQYELSKILFKYQTTPRKYSTDEEIYMMEMHLLNMIGYNEGISVSELATLSKRTTGAISQKINILQKKGFNRRR